MPELPEVETIRRGLEARLIGRTIAGLRIPPDRGKPVPVIKGMDEATFREGVVGARIEGVSRRGKYLSLDLDSGMMLVIHLRMTGALLFSDDPDDLHVRAIFTLDDGTIMRFTDVRKFGGLWLVDDLTQVTANLGTEPLSEEFLPDILVAAVTGRKAPIKSILLDQKNIAGIGNIYADEACFLAGVDPRRLGATLTAGEASPCMRRFARCSTRVSRTVAPASGTIATPRATSAACRRWSKFFAGRARNATRARPPSSAPYLGDAARTTALPARSSSGKRYNPGMRRYRLTVHVSKQENGLWRAEVPELPGCFADGDTLREALNDIQECAVMVMDVMAERGSSLPESVAEIAADDFDVSIPIVVDEFAFIRPSRKAKRLHS